MTNQQVYSKASKLESLRSLVQANKPVTQIAKELGVRRTLLYNRFPSSSAMGEGGDPRRPKYQAKCI